MPLSVRHTLEQTPAHDTDAQYPKRGPRDAPEGGGPPYPCDEVFDVRGVLEFEFLARRLALDCEPIWTIAPSLLCGARRPGLHKPFEHVPRDRELETPVLSRGHRNVP